MTVDPATLADRIAIDDLLTQYATALDCRDWPRWRSCFSDDAWIDYTSAGGIAGTADEVGEWLAAVMPHFAMTQHLVTNREIEIDGDRARARSAFFNPLGVARPEGSLTLYFDGGYYNDELVRTAAGWRIARRIEESSYSTRLHPLGATRAG